MPAIIRRLAVNGVQPSATATANIPFGQYRWKRFLIRVTGTTGTPSRAITFAEAFAGGPNDIEFQINGKSVRTFSAVGLLLDNALYNNQQRGFGTGYAAQANVGFINFIEPTFDRTLYAPGLTVAASLPREGDSLALGTQDASEIVLYLRLSSVANVGIELVGEYDPVFEPLGSIVGVRYASVAVAGATENQTITLPGGAFNLMSILIPSPLVTSAELTVGAVTQFQTSRENMQAYQAGNFYTGLPFAPYSGADADRAFVIDLCRDRDLESSLPMSQGGRARTDILLRPSISGAGTIPIFYRVYGPFTNF